MSDVLQERTKWFNVGRTPDGEVFVKCRLTVEDGKRKLSLTGVIGPTSGGDCKGSCGQISLDGIEAGPGWDPESVRELARIWDAWHLNDMRPGCEHQRAENWDERPIDPGQPIAAYGKFFPEQRAPSWNMLTWIARSEHPEGLLEVPCPTCGYKYGSAWLYEPLPDEVVEWLGKRPTVDAPKGWDRG